MAGEARHHCPQQASTMSIILLIALALSVFTTLTFLVLAEG